MENFDKIKALVASIEADVQKFEVKGVKAAGPRIRKGMQELKVLAQAVRTDVQEAKKSEEG